jgi:hypothetical protein
MARAASTTPGSTDTRFCSTMRPITKVAMTDIGNSTERVPTVVPIASSVSGPTAVMKMMNGIGRMMLTSTLSTANNGAFANRPPRRVVWSPTPRTSPNSPAISIVQTTMYTVCWNDSHSSGASSSQSAASTMLMG